MTDEHEFDNPAVYRITVRGNLEDKWSAWFEGFSINPYGNKDTVMSGVVADQAALHGLLAKIRDLGLPLLEVKRLQAGEIIIRRNNDEQR